MQIVAPILIELPGSRKRIHFQDFCIRKIKETEKKRFLNAHLVDLWHMTEISNSNFCLARYIKNNSDYENINRFQDSVQNFRKTLRLIGCKINLCHFTLGNNSMGFAGPHSQASHVNQAYAFSESDIKKIKDIYRKVKSHTIENNSKFEIISQRYESSLSASQVPANKFVDAVTVLESLILPGKNRGELNTRLAIITSNLLSKEYKADRKESFAKIKDYYDIRSDFVHSGHSRKYTKEKMEDVQEIARQILLLFLDKNELFEEKNLENLLIN